MKESQLKTPVALVFFNRPNQFEKVFEKVREAAPSILFLIQDGPRAHNPNDVLNISKCREIVDRIDWDCHIEKIYSDINLGCGKRVFTGISQCFEKVDRLIILEDDCVPSSSFFPFCEEMLEKYKDDQRIGMITGMNHLNQFDSVKSDYFFSNVGSIAGWATWRRTWYLADYDLSTIVNDEEAMRLVNQYQKYAPNANATYDNLLLKKKLMDKGEQLSSWSTQIGVAGLLQSNLVIVPRLNLMSNIGLTEDSANSVGDIRCIPHGLRPLYQLKLHELNFPLNHPKYVFNDIEYCKAVDKLMGRGRVASFCRRIESLFLRMIYGDFKSIKKSILRRLRK